MGTDIHAHAEFRNNAGQWQKIQEYDPFEGRNYNAFSLFAGVRFRNDFHGRYVSVYDEFFWAEMCVTPHPIAQPRGLPEDVSPSVKAESDSWGPDGHSHSWLSVDELTSYDYDKPLKRREPQRAQRSAFLYPLWALCLCGSRLLCFLRLI